MSPTLRYLHSFTRLRMLLSRRAGTGFDEVGEVLGEASHMAWASINAGMRFILMIVKDL